MSTDFNFRRLHQDGESDPREAMNCHHPRHSHATMAWVAGGTAVAGIFANLYGQNKQAKAQSAADASNRAAIEKQNQDAWNAYLLQRGIYGANAPTGTIPGAVAGSAQNTRLPLWATIQQTTPGVMVGGGAAMPAGVGATGAPRKFF